MPVRRKEGSKDFEVLLVRSRWVEGVWLFPKGGVEENEGPKMSAIRETREVWRVESPNLCRLCLL